MIESAPNRPSRGHKWLQLLALVVAVVVIYLGSVCLRILQEASQQEIHPADAIVVFGAAEYSGRPSPVYRARLDHGLHRIRQRVGGKLQACHALLQRKPVRNQFFQVHGMSKHEAQRLSL